MKIELLHIVNGHRKFHIGFFDNIQDAVKTLKREVAINSEIDKPRWDRNYNEANDTIRIDYGLKTCYYLMQAVEVNKWRMRNGKGNDL